MATPPSPAASPAPVSAGATAAPSTSPVPLTLALAQQSAVGAVSGGITVTLQQEAPGLTDSDAAVAATIAVAVPQAIAQQAQGFNFPLPGAIQQAVQQAMANGNPVIASGSEGEPLPGWLRFDAETLRFIASNVPAGALPYQARLRFGAESALIVVTEASD